MNSKEQDILITYISQSRLKSYEDLSNEKEFKIVIEKYKDNIKISAYFYELLSYFEIFLRNKIDLILSKNLNENWINTINFRDKHKEQIKEIEEKLKKRKKNYNKHDIISNLQLGFWIHLFDKNYQQNLWYKCLNQMFPNKTNRQDISNKLNGICELRNRISHYEIIIKDSKRLTTNMENILFFINTFDDTLYNWITKNCEIIKMLKE